MLKILVISDNTLVEPMINELEALGHEISFYNTIDFAVETITKERFDIILLDYKETLKLSDEEVFNIRYFYHTPYEIPIYILIEKEKTKLDIKKRNIFSGIFPYNHSLNMINEFITNFQLLSAND